MEAYLASLPGEGAEEKLGAHADQLARASLVHGIRAHLDWETGTLPAGLAAVEALLARPPAPEGWIPEVHHFLALLAAADQAGLDADAFVDATYRFAQHQVPQPFFQRVSSLVSERQVLRGAVAQWVGFHRGLRLSITFTGRGRALLELSYPPALMNEALARAYVGTLQASAERTQVAGVQVEFLSHRATSSQYEMTFDPV